MLKKFLTDNSALYRLYRTIVQGVIGVIIANLDVIITSQIFFPDWSKPIIVGIIMAILAPIMSALGGKENE